MGHSDDVNCCDWFPDNYAFATGSYGENNIKCGVTSLKFSKTGKYLLCGYDDPPYMMSWGTLSGERTQSFYPLLKHRVSCLDLNCTGNAFATGSWDHNIRVWS